MTLRRSSSASLPAAIATKSVTETPWIRNKRGIFNSRELHCEVGLTPKN
jgi:hypothetical protein